MSEDEPLEPVEPEPVGPGETEPATEPITVMAPTTETPTWPGDPAAPAAASGPPPGGSSTVAVPKWLLFVAGAVVVAVFAFAVGFAAGWIAAPGDDDHESARVRIPREMGPGSNGGRGDGNTLPTLPARPDQGANTAFLGVATTRSTDPSGAQIARVVPDSPAADAGLETDDVITKVDDGAVSSPDQLALRIAAKEAGDQVTITYVRDGDTATKDVTLVRRSTIAPSTPTTTEPQN